MTNVTDECAARRQSTEPDTSDRGPDGSLDGFVDDGDGSAKALYPDFNELRGGVYMQSKIDETGSVIMGRRSFEMPDDPDTRRTSTSSNSRSSSFTQHPPAVKPKENDRLTFTFVTDGVESAAAQA